MLGKKPIHIWVSFQVPVLGDGGSNYVELNEQAVFALAKGFDLTSDPGPLALKDKVTKKKVGEVTLSTNGSKELVATVVFNGDADIFTGESGWGSVECTFHATLQYDSSGIDDNGKAEDIYLLDKQFSMVIPATPVTVEMEKDGAIAAGEYIDWKVHVTPKQGALANVDMSGFIFRDSLTGVGTYEADSFYAGATDNIAGATQITEDIFKEGGNTVYYEFPAGTTGERWLFFRTKISDDVLFANGKQTVTNTATVTDKSGEVFDASTGVEVDSKWIEKEGAESTLEMDPSTGKAEQIITWTITANQMGVSLTNAVIVDELPIGLGFVEASYELWKGSAWVSSTSITPSGAKNSEYKLSTINTPVKLKIKTKVVSTSGTDEGNIGHKTMTLKIKQLYKGFRTI